MRYGGCELTDKLREVVNRLIWRRGIWRRHERNATRRSGRQLQDATGRGNAQAGRRIFQASRQELREVLEQTRAWLFMLRERFRLFAHDSEGDWLYAQEASGAESAIAKIEAALAASPVGTKKVYGNR